MLFSWVFLHLPFNVNCLYIFILVASRWPETIKNLHICRPKVIHHHNKLYFSFSILPLHIYVDGIGIWSSTIGSQGFEPVASGVTIFSHFDITFLLHNSFCDDLFVQNLKSICSRYYISNKEWRSTIKCTLLHFSLASWIS